MLRYLLSYSGSSCKKNRYRPTSRRLGIQCLQERKMMTGELLATTIQLPTFEFTSVATTVSVPDGGTVLLGGIKRLPEGKVEQGVPNINNIPYVDRLFRNVAASRDTDSLMLMVTPRIIIQEEEELA